MTDNDPNQPEKPPKGYGKRPLWQWIVIYIIVAIIVYSLIYVLFLNDNGGSGSGY